MKKIFKDYLLAQNQYIDFNGNEYTLLTKNNEVVIVTDTPQEMFYFIQGWILSNNQSQNQIKELMEINSNNIKNYEKIIEESINESKHDNF